MYRSNTASFTVFVVVIGMKRTGRRTSIQNEFISIPEQPRACPCCRCGGRCWQFSRIANVEICSSVVAAAVLLLAEPSRVGGPCNPLCWLLNGLGGSQSGPSHPRQGETQPIPWPATTSCYSSTVQEICFKWSGKTLINNREDRIEGISEN